MENVYRQAFAEVLEVLKNSNQNIIEKIPEKFIAFLNKNKDNDYIVNIDFFDKNWENFVKKETRAILALIYRDYIVSSEERKKLLVEENEEQIKIENELREKYNPDDIFRKKNEIQETTMLVVKKEKWYKKIFNIIKNLFKKINK